MKRILIIEDDAGQRILFKTALERAGFEVVEAVNGRAGMQSYTEHPCDLVITDIFMPEEDGVETIFELKTQSPTVKVIAISGGGSWTQYGRTIPAEEPLDIAKHFGADRTLAKPVKIHQLLTMVDELLHVKGRLYPA